MARPARDTRTRSEVDDIAGDPPSTPTPAAQGAAPTATPAAAPSSGLPRSSQAELEAQLASIAPNGDGSKLRHTADVVTKQVPNPAAKLKPGDVGWSPGAPATLPQQVLVHTWINDATGDTVKAETQDDGSYVVTKSGDTKAGAAAARPPVAKQAKSVTIGTNPNTGKPTQITVWDDNTTTYDDTQVPASATAQAKPPEEKDENGRHSIWQPNPGGPDKGGQWLDVGPSAAKYDQQEVLVNGQRHLVVTASVPGQPPTQAFYGPDGKPETALPTEAPAYSARDEVVNGKHYTVITSAPKDGSAPKVQWKDPDGNVVPAPSEVGQEKTTDITRNGATYTRHEQPDPTTGKSRVFYTDQSGKEVPLPDDSATSFGTLPKEVPQFAPDYSQNDGGLTARRDQLNELVNNHIIDKATARAVMEQDAALWEYTRAHGNDLANQDSTTRAQDVTQRQQDIGEVASRRSAADDMFGKLYSDSNQNTELLGKGGGAVATRAFLEALDLAKGNAEQWGGLADVPQVASPYTQAMRTHNVKIGPDGSVSIKSTHPVAPEAPAPAAPDAAAPPSGDAGPTVAGAPAVGPGPSSGPTGWDFAPGAAAPGEPQVTYRDQWGNQFTVPKSQFDARPGGNADVTVVPTDPATPATPTTVPGGEESQVNPTYTNAVRPPTPLFDPSGSVAWMREKKIPEDVIAEAVATHQAERQAA